MLLEAASLKSFAHSLIYEYLGKTGVKLADFCGDIIGALLILFIGFKIVSYVVKMAHKIFERSIMDTTLQTFLLSFIKIGGKVLVIFMAVTKIGVAASSIVALLGSAGLALGLSLQGSLSNIAGGVILLLLKPFQVGDYIIEGNSGKEGTVQAIGIMYTKLLSVDNKAIMIPNGNLSNASITNVTYQEKRRVDLNVGIEYSEDIKKVRKVLNALIKEPARITDEPVKIYVNEFQASSIDIGIRYWVKTEDYWESRWRVLEEIKEEFDNNNIAIPFEQLDVNLIPQEKRRIRGRKFTMEKNLTTGSVLKSILYFSLPYLLSYFLQTLYGMADLFIIGQFEDISSITAVSIGSQVMHMITVMIVGLAMGATVNMDRR